MQTRQLLSGNEAVALSAFHRKFALGTGYPGTPSTEILEYLANLDRTCPPLVRTQWAPNEKVAFEVGLGAAFAGSRVLVTMKHVGVNVAADSLFSAAYASIPGALVLISADDPGMASSQNEQDNRRYAIAAGIPVLEPSDAQQAYDYVGLAVSIAERWQLPVMVRMTTRVCHGKSVVVSEPLPGNPEVQPYRRDVPGRVMLPGYARDAHRRLRQKLEQVAEWAENDGVTRHLVSNSELGVICSGVTAMHVLEALPTASVLVVGMCHPAPLNAMRAFAASVPRCMVIEEGDPVLFEIAMAGGVKVEPTPKAFRFGELNVERVRRIAANEPDLVVDVANAKAPELCPGCPHRAVLAILAEHDLIVAGDIGCYTLGALPPFSVMDSVICMGASIGVGLGLRHTFSKEDQRRVVSVIGDSTFVHSGIGGLVEMVYNAPEAGHVVIILDNGTTAMTGQQEHPATGRSLRRQATARLSIEQLVKAIGVQCVEVIDPHTHAERFESTLLSMLDRRENAVIVARRPCILAARAQRAPVGASQTKSPACVVAHAEESVP